MLLLCYSDVATECDNAKQHQVKENGMNIYSNEKEIW
jgi:hypothetical protein